MTMRETNREETNPRALIEGKFPEKAFGNPSYYFPKVCFPLVQSVPFALVVRDFHVYYAGI